MIRDELTEEDCGLNSSWSISCSFPISFFSSLISNWRNSILWNMPRRSFSILIAVWNFTFLVPLGNCSLRHAVFFSKFSCSYSFTHLCSPQIDAVKYYSVNLSSKAFLLQISKQIRFVHAILQHLPEAILYCCDIFMVGHAVPGVIGFQNLYGHRALLQ